jgi:hypothetical protein
VDQDEQITEDSYLTREAANNASNEVPGTPRPPDYGAPAFSAKPLEVVEDDFASIRGRLPLYILIDVGRRPDVASYRRPKLRLDLAPDVVERLPSHAVLAKRTVVYRACHASRSPTRCQPCAWRSQRCSRMLTFPPRRIGTCVRAVRPSAPRKTTVSETTLSSPTPDVVSHWLRAARTSSCDFTHCSDSPLTRRDSKRGVDVSECRDSTAGGCFTIRLGSGFGSFTTDEGDFTDERPADDDGATETNGAVDGFDDAVSVAEGAVESSGIRDAAVEIACMVSETGGDSGVDSADNADGAGATPIIPALTSDPAAVDQ